METCKICNGRKEIEVLVMGTDTDWVECPYCKLDEKIVERIKKINKLQKVSNKKIYSSSQKTNKNIMRKKKNNPSINLKIYKKICERVRIVEIKDDDGYPINYLVQSKRTRKQEWHTLSETISLKKAIQKKHFQVHVAIRDLGYGYEFLRRRKKRKGY